MKVLVTGAAGFVGGWLVPRLRERGHEVLAAVGPGPGRGRVPSEVPVVVADLRDAESVARLAETPCDAVVHLAAQSAASDQGVATVQTYEVNVVGTVRLVETIARWRTKAPVRFLHVSSGLVYGQKGTRPFREDDPVSPVGPYAVSKYASELCVRDIACPSGMETVVARSFSHTGPGQDQRFVIPAFAGRIREGMRLGAAAIGVGNLDPVRDFLHVADVVEAYITLLERGAAGTVYNVASGEGVTIRDLFHRIADAVGYRVVPEMDTAYLRAGDTAYSVGDAARLRAEFGWQPQRTLDQMIDEVVHAEAD